MNIGSFELLVLALSAVLLLIIIAGSFRLEVPRKVSLQGIEDPKAAEAYDQVAKIGHSREGEYRENLERFLAN
jgi:hypothetical protein